MYKKFAIPAVLALTTAGAVMGVTGTVHAETAVAKKTPTHFAMKAAGFGTRIQGGQVPASSDTTGYQVIGCTNKAGIVHKNYEASVTLPGLGVAEGVKTKVWTATSQHGKVVSAYSMHNVAKVRLGQSSIGNLTLNAVNSLSRAYHDGSGFHTTTKTSIGSITVTASGQDPQTVPIPTPDQPVTIPGLATIAIGDSINKHGRHAAYASANAVDITVLATGTRVRVSHSAAQLYDGITHGIFKGYANGTRGDALATNAKVGPTPLQYIPCQGTRGKVRGKDIAGVNLGDNVIVGAVSTRGMGKQLASKSRGFMQGEVASVNIGGGQLVIDAIRGRANVARYPGGKVVRTATGTTVGAITANGQPQSLPDSGVLEIPGVAKIETHLVKKSHSGITVTALRVTLLDGTGAVLNFGQARLNIKPSGL